MHHIGDSHYPHFPMGSESLPPTKKYKGDPQAYMEDIPAIAFAPTLPGQDISSSGPVQKRLKSALKQALESIRTSKDERGLEWVLDQDESLASRLWEEQGLRHFPIYRKLVKLEHQTSPKTAEERGNVATRIDRLSEQYFAAARRQKVPLQAYLYAGYVKIVLGKFEEADSLYAEAFAKYSRAVTPNAFFYAARSKDCQNQLEEAAYLYGKAIAATGENVPANWLAHAASVNMKLKRWAEADAYFDRAIPLYGEKAPLRVYEDAIRTKMALNKKGESIPAYGAKVPASLYFKLARIKKEEKEFGQAEELYRKGLEAAGETALPFDYYFAAEVKVSLGKLLEAQNYLQKAVEGYDKCVPGMVTQLINEVQTLLAETGQRRSFRVKK